MTMSDLRSFVAQQRRRQHPADRPAIIRERLQRADAALDRGDRAMALHHLRRAGEILETLAPGEEADALDVALLMALRRA